MTIQNHLPKIQPSLNLDFVNMKGLDPRVNFQRTSRATYFDGSICQAEENLLQGGAPNPYEMTIVDSPLNSYFSGLSGVAPQGLIHDLHKCTSDATADGWSYIRSSAYGLHGGEYYTASGVVAGWNKSFFLTCEYGSTDSAVEGKAGILMGTSNDVLLDGYTDGLGYQTLSVPNGDFHKTTGNAADDSHVINWDDKIIFRLFFTVSDDGTYALKWSTTVKTPAVAGQARIKLIHVPDAKSQATYTSVPSSKGAFTLGSHEFHAGMLQVEQRKEPSIYQNSTSRVTNTMPQMVTVEPNVVRFPVHPVTREREGLLTEMGRDNYMADFDLWESASFSNLASACKLIRNYPAPDGTLRAYKLCENGAAAGEVHQRIYKTLTVTQNAEYVWSFYAKAGERDMAYSYAYHASGVAEIVMFNLRTGTFYYPHQSNEPKEAGMDYIGNGWYRCWQTIKNPSDTSSTLSMYAMDSGGTTINTLNANRTGDGVSGIYIFGVQFELGHRPTSFIPNFGYTSTTTVTRQSEIVSISGQPFEDFYNQKEGTFVIDHRQAYWPIDAKTVAGADDEMWVRIFDLRTDSTYEAFRLSNLIYMKGRNYYWYAIYENSGFSAGTTYNYEPDVFKKHTFVYDQSNQAIERRFSDGITNSEVSTKEFAKFTMISIASHVGGTWWDQGVQSIKQFTYYPAKLTEAEQETLLSIK